MTNFSRIKEINDQCMRNVEAIMAESKNIIKKFKIEQAEIMKNIVVSTDDTVSLEQQFRKFQSELSQRENEQYNQINGRINAEIETMRKLIMQELASPSVSPIGQTNDPAFDAALNSFDPDYVPIPTNPKQEKVMPSSVSEMSSSVGEMPSAQQMQNSMSKNNSNNTTPSNASQEYDEVSKSLENLTKEVMNNPNTDNNIPVETRELDEWITEIKNLI